MGMTSLATVRTDSSTSAGNASSPQTRFVHRAFLETLILLTIQSVLRLLAKQAPITYAWLSNVASPPLTGRPVRHIPDWFPGARFKKQAKAWFRLHEDFVDESLDYVRKEMVSRDGAYMVGGRNKDSQAAGNAPESYVSKRLGKNLSLQDYDILRYGASAIFIGALVRLSQMDL